ncbi:hypothetical protein FVEN_g4020 [Fusarium venenatum]|uniref:Uncharacterized protein n=1 Tax=Fusarium venenatum TaxID=56646 RepID=A0A2L2TX75_9HYPO|nr:uncharacterized protein FVRRES_09303 [Fusarium venenatum]KAG8358303.1 hypothetical protein FVEN_g4020 [Fusarium venenatum]KAH6965991.1 hypothetical protein EDB82DRAFT_529699 [Fusarium venenatum]CEI69226.1 unnamed protein product [Fusarium venenatum]
MSSLTTPLTLIAAVKEIEDVAITTADRKLNLPLRDLEKVTLGNEHLIKRSGRSRRSIGISTLWFLLVKIPIIVIVLLITCAWLCLRCRKKKDLAK